MKLIQWLSRFPGMLLEFPENETSPRRYRILRRNMIILMAVVTLVPLLTMAVINYVQYQSALKKEIVNPMRSLVSKTRHSFELFLAERLSAVSFISSAYPCEDLVDARNLNHIFRAMKREFGGFVDLGVISAQGVQSTYAGPYDLLGKNYSEQSWFHEVQLRGVYVSDVFLGYRQFPHIVIAVNRLSDEGDCFIVRATIDTEKFNTLIASMGLDPQSDAFLLNREGVFQTNSKFYGSVLQKCSLPLPPLTYDTNVIETKDPSGREIILAYTYLVNPNYVLMAVKPRGEVMRSWYTLKSELFLVFIVSVVVIFFVVFRLTDRLVHRVLEADERREAAFREMEHTHKLSSIGRLAAGVAHEINNPLAIINEKAGLMKDLINIEPEFPRREKFVSLADAILGSVERCRGITHRLLGFARRMEVTIETLDLNDVLKEVLGFLEKEALFRNVTIHLHLAEDLPKIASDRGQLQQVFLNILNNGFAAVEDGGTIVITTWEKDVDFVGAAVQDNGCGMSGEILKHIFEPFFTTKTGYGTGLGLPITYGIVKKLGGDIEVQSKEGEGTTFFVYLPIRSKATGG